MQNLIFYFLLILYFSSDSAFAEITIETVWGERQINDSLVEKLVHHKTLQRLKEIDQSGPIPYFGLAPYFSRYDHSIGVFDLLKKANVSIEEQVAGLLHDVSHTAFSHVGDHLFYESNGEKSYQDTIHLWFLEKEKVHFITEEYKIDLKRLDPDLPEYKALEKPLPDLCADRIQYILHTGVIFKKISRQEVKLIVDNLKFENGIWFFTEIDYAKKLAVLSLVFTEALWGAPWNFVFYEYFSKILKRAIELKLVSNEEMHFGTDKTILQKLQKSNDSYIKKNMRNLEEIHQLFKVVKFGTGNLNVRPKFRGVDPFVKINKEYKRLSSLDLDFKNKFETVRKWCEKGYGVTLNSPF